MSISYRSEKKPKQWVTLETTEEFYHMSMKYLHNGVELAMNTGIHGEGPGDLCIKNFVDCTEGK